MTPRVIDIQTAVCEQFSIKMREMKSDRQARVFSRPRQVAMYLCREMTPLSTPAIARQFKRDHSTVMYACRVIEKLIQQDRTVAAIVERLRFRIASGDQLPLPLSERAWRSYGA